MNDLRCELMSFEDLSRALSNINAARDSQISLACDGWAAIINSAADGMSRINFTAMFPKMNREDYAMRFSIVQRNT